LADIGLVIQGVSAFFSAPFCVVKLSGSGNLVKFLVN